MIKSGDFNWNQFISLKFKFKQTYSCRTHPINITICLPPSPINPHFHQLPSPPNFINPLPINSYKKSILLLIPLKTTKSKIIIKVQLVWRTLINLSSSNAIVRSLNAWSCIANVLLEVMIILGRFFLQRM